MRKLVVAIGVVAAWLGTTEAALGQDRQPEPAQYRALVACRSQTDEAARLRCYDQAVAALEQAASRGDILLTGREEVRAARRSLFGFAVPRFLRGRDEAEEPEITELETTIVSARETGFQEFILVLAEGGRWQTTEASRGARTPRPGTAVRLRRSPVGGYFVKLPGVQWLRARRIE